MKKIFIAVAITVLSNQAFSQVRGNSSYNQTTIEDNAALTNLTNDGNITLSISGLLNAKADTYVAFFHILQVGHTASMTDSLMNVRIKKFKSIIQRSGLDTSSVHTDMISFVPKYEVQVFKKLFSKTFNEVPDGFEMQKNVIVNYKKPDQLNTIVTAAASAEIYDLVKVDYFVNDIEKEHGRLRENALKIFKERLKTLQVAGIKIDSLKTTFADDFGTTLPQERYGQYQAIARPSFKGKDAPGEGSKLSYYEPTASRYYQALSYDDFDFVINPIVSEPMVQLTYQMKVRFTLKSEKQKPQPANYLFIGSNGQVQKLDLNIP
jgi:uncharacterized protein YggE